MARDSRRLNRANGRLSAALFACALFSAALFTPSLQAAPKSNLTLGSTNITSSHFLVSDAMAKAIMQGIPGSRVSHIETGASIDNIRRLTKSELDLGLTATDAAIIAINGTGPFAGKAVPDLVALYAYDLSVLNIAVSQASKVTNLAELAGKKLSPGIRGSAAEQLTRQVFKTLGIEPELVSGTLKDAVEGIQNRQIAGYSKYGPGLGIDATLRELIVTTPMRLLSFSPEQAKKISSTIRGVGFTKVANAMEGQPDVLAPTVMIVYAALKSAMTDETAYAIAKSIDENKQLLIEAWPHLKNFDFKARALELEGIGVPLHPGAKRYWQSLK